MNIQKININKNGYVSVITTGNSYKTVVITYSPEGKELFKTYLSSSIAIDTSISYDNKYLALAEIDTSGSTIQSSIKIISLEKAQNTPKESVIQKQKQQVNRLITDIEYQDKNKILILCDDGIYTLDESSQNQKLAFEKSKITFASINLNNYMAYSIEKKSGLFTNTQVNLKNINTDKENIYTTGGTIKDIKTSTNKIALNLGSQVEFINTIGWEIKKYISEKEITDIVIADNIAGIVYKDKIEIINL